MTIKHRAVKPVNQGKCLLLTAIFCICAGISAPSLADTSVPSPQPLKMAKPAQPLLKLRTPQPSQTPPGSRPMPGQLSTGKKDDNKLISRCWGVEACNQMISDCIAVGGDFHPGLEDPETGAPGQGYCSL